MDDGDWQTCLATAESSSSDSWQIQWQETKRIFYKALNQVRIQQGLPPFNHPSFENQENIRSVFVKIQFEKYEISVEVLYQVFSGFGVIENIEKFGSSIGFHSQIRFQNKESAIKAFSSLNGRNIYDHCCQLELFLVEEIETEPCNPTDDEPDQERELEGPTDETEFDDSKHAIETIAPIVQDAAETLDGSHQSAFELPRSVRQDHKARLESSMARQGMEIVEEFNKIEQEDDLDKYNEKFEGLRVGMLAYNPDLPEMYFVASYIRGLRPEVRLLVEIGRLESLAAALKLSQLHNKGVQAMLRISKNPWRTLDSETQFVEDEALELTQGGENPGVDRRLIDDSEYGKDLAHNEEIADSFEVLNQEIKEVPDDLLNQSKSTVQDELKINSMPFNDDDREKLPNQQRTFKVNRKLSKPLIYGGEINWLAELVILLIELMEIRLANSRIESVGSVRNSSAHQVFEKMFEKGICSFAELGCQEIFSGVLVFDPGIAGFSMGLGVYRRVVKLMTGLGIQLKDSAVTWPYDRGKERSRSCCWDISMGCWSADLETDSGMSFVFDPGILEWINRWVECSRCSSWPSALGLRICWVQFYKLGSIGDVSVLAVRVAVIVAEVGCNGTC